MDVVGGKRVRCFWDLTCYFGPKKKVFLEKIKAMESIS
jgi:hypothetical protein